VPPPSGARSQWSRDIAGTRADKSGGKGKANAKAEVKTKTKGKATDRKKQS